MDRMEQAEWLRERAEEAKSRGDWDLGEALEGHADYLINDADDA